MILPLGRIFGRLNNSKYKSIILALEILFILTVLLAGQYIFFHKAPTDKKTTKTQISDLVKPKTYKVDGVTYNVPAKVLQIEAETLNRQITTHEAIQVVHVATATEWQQGHIIGSTFETKEYLGKSPNLSRDQSYVFVSKNENDSIEVAGKLVDAGYLPTKVQCLKGGLSAWTARGYKLEK